MKNLTATRLALQILNYTLFMVLVWYLSIKPPYRQLGEDQAVVTLAFGHTGKLVEECRKMSQEELLKLPPNMRKPMECPRERSPITVELSIDGESMIREVHEAPGLYNDQGIDVYRSIKVPAGHHGLTVWMIDDVHTQAPIYQLSQSIDLKPSQHLVVDFDAAAGVFAVN